MNEACLPAGVQQGGWRLRVACVFCRVLVWDQGHGCSTCCLTCGISERVSQAQAAQLIVGQHFRVCRGSALIRGDSALGFALEKLRGSPLLSPVGGHIPMHIWSHNRENV